MKGQYTDGQSDTVLIVRLTELTLRRHPAVEPVFAGFWDCRAIVPAAEAVAKVGSRIDLKEPRQNMCCGDGCIIYHDVLDDGENVCIVVGGLTPPDWSKESWRQSVSRTWLEDLYQDWGEFGQSMLDVSILPTTQMKLKMLSGAASVW